MLWAFSFGLIKGQLAGIDPFAVAFWRLAISAAAFAPWLVHSRIAGSLAARALGLGALQFGLMYVLYIASYRYLPAYGVALFTIFTPLYVALLFAALDRRLRWHHLGAALLAVAGAAVVTSGGLVSGAGWQGVLLLQLANVCFAVGQVLFRRFVRTQRREEQATTTLLAWMYLGAALVTGLGAALFADRFAPPPDGRVWLVILYLGLLPTAVGFYLWNRGAIRVKPGILAAGNNLKIPLAVLVSWLVFGESADYLRVTAGLAIIVAALVWAGRD